MFNFTLPNLNDLGALGQEQDTKKIKAYLFQLTDQLRYVLNNLDTENFTQQAADQISSASEKAEQVGTAVNGLEDEIKLKADKVTVATKGEVEEVSGALNNLVEKVSTYETETEAYKEEVASYINQDAEKLVVKFTERGQNEDGTISYGPFEAQIVMSKSGIEISTSDNPVKVILGPSGGLRFKYNDIELAKLDESVMEITRANISRQLIIGGDVGGLYDVEAGTTYGLRITKRQGGIT